MITALVHIVVLWIFATRLAGDPGTGEAKPPPGAGIVSLTLAPPAAAAADAPSPAARPIAAPEATKVDLTTKTDVPPPEWTVSAIASAAPTATGAASPGTASATGSGTGGGVYDPFAGAAPLRSARTLVHDASVNGLVPVGDESGLRLDERMFESVRLALARANPGVNGTLDLAMRVSQNGLVLEVAPVGGSLARHIGKQAANTFLGKRLFAGTASGTVALQLRVMI
jgi:hypothetical protein